jgi:hypothetical protein
MKKVLICLAALACIAVPAAQAATSISVVGAAALEGSFGMRAHFDGTTSAAYVQDNSPNNEKNYFFSFKLRRDALTMTPSVLNVTNHTQQLFTAFNTESSPTGANIAIRVNIFSNQTGAGQPFAIHAFPRLDDGSFDTRLAVNTLSGIHQYTIEWHASSAPGANDGSMKFYRDQVLSKQGSGYDNDTWAINMVRFGVPNTADATAAGDLDLDSFVSTRTPQF